MLTNTVIMKGWAPRIGLDWVPSHEYVATTDIDGNVLGEVKPLKEVDIHLRIYRSREDVGAVIHAHPPYLIRFKNPHPEGVVRV